MEENRSVLFSISGILEHFSSSWKKIYLNQKIYYIFFLTYWM